MRSISRTVVFLASVSIGASVPGGDYEILLGSTSLGDYCGVMYLDPGGGVGGLGGGDPYPMGIWAFSSCTTPIGSRECSPSPFYMGWFAYFTNGYFFDEACCPGNQVRNAYIVFVNGSPSSAHEYRCEDYN